MAFVPWLDAHWDITEVIQVTKVTTLFEISPLDHTECDKPPCFLSLKPGEVIIRIKKTSGLKDVGKTAELYSTGYPEKTAKVKVVARGEIHKALGVPVSPTPSGQLYVAEIKRVEIPTPKKEDVKSMFEPPKPIVSKPKSATLPLLLGLGAGLLSKKAGLAGTSALGLGLVVGLGTRFLQNKNTSA